MPIKTILMKTATIKKNTSVGKGVETLDTSILLLGPGPGVAAQGNGAGAALQTAKTSTTTGPSPLTSERLQRN